jgi:hypothetical protein
MQHDSALGLPHSRAMGSTMWLGKRVVGFGIVALLMTACTPDTSSSDEQADDKAVPEGTVEVPPERLTPFCEAMIELSDTLETDPPADPEALVIETYLGIEDEVPPEIAPDFQAVLADLQGTTVSTVAAAGTGGSLPTDGEDPSDEGYLPSDDPTVRLTGYVDFTCRSNINNPGPPATQPHDDLVPPTTDS